VGSFACCTGSFFSHGILSRAGFFQKMMGTFVWTRKKIPVFAGIFFLIAKFQLLFPEGVSVSGGGVSVPIH
jgi:hypothetical protein